MGTELTKSFFPFIGGAEKHLLDLALRYLFLNSTFKLFSMAKSVPFQQAGMLWSWLNLIREDEIFVNHACELCQRDESQKSFALKS